MSEYSTNKRQCCDIELNTDYNCIENYCNVTLWNASKACYEFNLFSKYNTYKNFTCGIYECCYFVNWLMCPFALLGDIIVCPCRSFLYCEKYVECGCNNMNKIKKTKDIITTQPK
jgi:hypothetical protein